MTATATIFENKFRSLTSKQGDSTELSPEEVRQRVLTLNRFRELLRAQRDRFREYLATLDKQQDAIARGAVEELSAHVEIEEQLASDILSIQKVIDPLENMYRDVTGEEGRELAGLKSALHELGKDASSRMERNKGLLSDKMAELRTEIKTLRMNPFAAPASIYGRNEEPSLIDIRG